MSDLLEMLEMLKTEDGQLNAVFACFGSAAQHAQFFEAALVEFLTAYNRLRNRSVTLADLEPFAAKMQEQPIDLLLKEFDKVVTINPDGQQSKWDIRGLMAMALENRNFLIHRFFLERGDALKTEAGRKKLLGELVLIQEEMEGAASMTSAMCRAMCRAMEGANQDDAPVSRAGVGDFSFEFDLPE